jgi:hypothetical protein
MSTRFLSSNLQDVQVTSVLADAAKGGWECQLETYQDTDAIQKWQAIELMLRLYTPSGWDEEEREVFVGHALPLGFNFDMPFSTARFNAATSNRFLENASLQGIGFTEQAAPTNDHQITGMRIGHMIEHIVEHHCNISTSVHPEGWVDTGDIDVTNSTRVDRYNIHATNNMWSTLQNMARNEFYYIYFDKLNALHYISHPMFDAVPPVPVMEFTADFCSGSPTVTPRAEKKVSQVILGATDADGTVYNSQYPPQPADEGIPKEMLRCRVGGAGPQARLDLLARRQYDWETRDWTVQWPAPGWCGFFFELLDRVQLTYTGTSYNGVEIDWTEKYFWIHRIQMNPGPGQTGTTVFTLEEEPTISPAP